MCTSHTGTAGRTRNHKNEQHEPVNPIADANSVV